VASLRDVFVRMLAESALVEDRPLWVIEGSVGGARRARQCRPDLGVPLLPVATKTACFQPGSTKG